MYSSKVSPEDYPIWKADVLCEGLGKQEISADEFVEGLKGVITRLRTIVSEIDADEDVSRMLFIRGLIPAMEELMKDALN